MRRRSDYLRLDPKRDVIGWQLDPVFDMNGWDIRKALVQFRKSNVSVFEWSRLPVVYCQREEGKRVCEAAEKYFSVKASLYQYYGIARSTYGQFLLGEQVKYKKYFYVLRPILACRYIWEHRCLPPIVFDELMKMDAGLDGRLKAEIEKLVEQKKRTAEGKLNPAVLCIQEFIREELEVWKERAESLTEERIRIKMT